MRRLLCHQCYRVIPPTEERVTFTNPRRSANYHQRCLAPVVVNFFSVQDAFFAMLREYKRVMGKPHPRLSRSKRRA